MPSRNLDLPGDVIVLPEADGRWVMMNVFVRSCLGVSGEVLRLLSFLAEQGVAEVLHHYGDTRFRVWDIHRFAHDDGLLADPTRYLRTPSQWPAAEELDVASLLARLQHHWLLIDDYDGYRARLAPKTSLLDGEHFGNLHQQLGQELWLGRRQAPDVWWLRQKFHDDLQSLRPTLYHAVQASCLDAYFRRTLSPGEVMIDLGCGIGFYANLMANLGASVLGIDPHADHIRTARQHAAPGARFEVMAVGRAGALDAIPTQSADGVFMSDTLLFYFVPMAPGQEASLPRLLDDIHRILKPDGRFVCMEHHLFWLLPWLGEVDRPFTILTEYQHKAFGVTPTLSRLIQACNRKGFVVTWMEEPGPEAGFEAVDARAYHFAREFPLWHLFEMKKA